MSFTTNKPAEGATPPAVILRVAGRESVPVSRAQLARSVRLYPKLALTVGCLTAGAMTGYALSAWGFDPKGLALLAVALPLGAICGVLAAMLRHSQKAKINGERDIEELIGLPPLAILPARKEVASGAYEAHLLRLAGAIVGANRSREAKVFLLTAVSESTNIEPLTAALRRKLEETGFQVFVAAPGDLLQPVPKMISGGFVAANLSLLSGAERLVLVQAGALLHSAETEFVAHCVDATILVVECAVTTRQALWRAAGLLKRMQVSAVGAVLEELPMRLADAEYRAIIEAAEKRMPFRPAASAAGVSESDLPSGYVIPGETREGAEMGPALVSKAVESAPRFEENTVGQTPDTAAKRFLHEKMSPELSVRPQAPESDGEPSMRSRMGWLGRLLGRDVEPTSIIPTEEDGANAPAAVGLTTASETAEEDYSAPLATRLDAISRQRPAASAGRTSSRLQIVPQDAPREIFVPYTRSSAEDKRDASVAALLADTSFAEEAKTDAAVLEKIDTAATEVTEPALPPRPAPSPVWQEPFEAESFETEYEAIEIPFEKPSPGMRRELLAQQQREWESGPAMEAEPPNAAVAEPVVEEFTVEESAPEILTYPEEPYAGQSGPHTGYEVLAFVPELRTPSEVAWRTHWQEPTKLVREPKREDGVQPAAGVDRYVQPMPAETAHIATPETERVVEEFPAQYDADDIEPVYEEVSRHLSSGRWDPIPTLRPDSTGWRDRPSPTPPTNPNVERRRWTGEDQELEAWRSGPSSGSGPRTDSLPEPLLTRQWGLLSKFQQSRLNSGSRPARTQEDEAVSTHGKGAGERV